MTLSLVFTTIQAQDISDANRYAQDNLNGTARFRAMSGAFGALGGDLSSLNVNPAGSVVFANNQIGVTLTNYNTNNNSKYFGESTKNKDNTFTLNQTGGVFVFRTDNPNEKWNKFTIGFNYENTNNYNNSIVSIGTNPTHSVADYFLKYANGKVDYRTVNNGNYINLNSREQQAFLGFKSYVIIPVNETPNNTQYTSNVPVGGNYYQENEVYTSGNSGKYTFNIGAQYDNFLSLGMNLNFHSIDYNRTSTFYEDNNNPIANDYQITSLRFNNDLHSYGSGFSFQLGAIAKVNNDMRFGLSYESNTWYQITDELSQKIVTARMNYKNDLLSAKVDPNYTNIYDPYTLQTPGKLTGSFAYIFGKSGLISIDYTLKNYKNTAFKPESNPIYKDLNETINNQMTTNSELRIGGEYKIQLLSLRAGYRYEDSPYKNGVTIGALNSYSGGLGYNFGSTKLDLSYTYAERKWQQAAFSQGLVDYATINNKNNNISMTLLFEL